LVNRKGERPKMATERATMLLPRDPNGLFAEIG
jgi:hypothetical protein